MNNQQLTELFIARAQLLLDAKEKLAEAERIKARILEVVNDGRYGKFVVGHSKRIKIEVRSYWRRGFRYIRGTL